MANFIPNQLSHIGVGGLPDADNASVANISNGGTFTGAWSQAPVGALLVVDLKADQDLTVQIQFSVNGSDADSTLTRYYRTAFINAPYTFKIARPYYRVVVTNNSGSATSTLRLNTYVTTGEAILNIPVDATMAKDYGAISTRPSDFTAEVATGRRQGWSVWNKFGYNEAISNAAAEVIAEWGGTFQYLTAGETIDIVSASTADDGDPAGTGAQQIIVYGVDQNWDLQTEVITMNGTTTVTTTTQWIGINRVSIYAAGSGKTNAGKITITATSSGYTMATMPVGVNSRGGSTTQQLIFYVPRNYQALATWVYFDAVKLAGGGGNPEMSFYGYVYSDVSGAEYEVYRDILDVANENRINLAPPEPFVIGEKSILWFEGITDNAGTSAVRGRLSLKLVRDVDA